MKPLIFITKGLPGSGKTTWARDFSKVIRNVDIVSKDDIRKKGVHSESKVIEERDRMIEESLKKGHSVIVADTNLNPTHEEHIRRKFSEQADIHIKNFDTSVEECIRRDSCRKASVGVRVIRSMYKKYLKK